jgi:hypothetical protein
MSGRNIFATGVAMLVCVACGGAAGASLWSVPVQLDASTGNAGGAQLAADAHGNILAAWQQSDSTQPGAIYRVWASRFGADAEPLGGELSSNAFNIRLVGNASGTAQALWQQFDGSICSSRYTPAAGWESASQLEMPGSGGAMAQLALDSQGNAVAVWQQTTMGASHIQYAHSPAGGSWEPAAAVDPANSSATQNAQNPQISFDAQGHALAIWAFAAGSTTNARSALYTNGAGWGAPLDVGNTSDVLDIALAVGADGNALAVWQQVDSSGASMLWWSSFE